MTRFLAIDVGDKRTGLAIGDDVTGVVTPGASIEQPIGELLVRALIRCIDDHAPDVIVIGLPLNMDGTEGPRAKLVRAFADQLERAMSSTAVIHLHDERLSTFAADQRMAQSGRTHKQKKKLRDPLAAAEILRDYLDCAET